MKTILGVLLLVLVMFSAAGCGGKKAAVPQKAEEKHEEHESGGKICLTISEESKETMGLKLGVVTYKNMEETLAVTGEVAKDTDKAYHISAREQGVIDEVKVQYGDIVCKGDTLAIIRNAKTGANEEIVSDYVGVVTGINATDDQQVDSLNSLFTISDISSINANFNVYEKDAGKVYVGQRVKVTTITYPDKFFSGKITFISPRIDDKTRTIKVRAEIDNNSYLLKYNMFLNGHIIISDGHYIAVSMNAVQRLKEKEIVFVAEGKNEFEAREIVTGFENNGFVQVKRGLSSGEEVVVEGSFLLKSELLKSEMGEGCAD